MSSANVTRESSQSHHFINDIGELDGKPVFYPSRSKFNSVAWLFTSDGKSPDCLTVIPMGVKDAVPLTTWSSQTQSLPCSWVFHPYPPPQNFKS